MLAALAGDHLKVTQTWSSRLATVAGTPECSQKMYVGPFVQLKPGPPGTGTVKFHVP